MAGLSGILGNVALQNILLYNVVGQLVGAGLGPYLQALTNQVQAATPLVPLTPADLALAVIRNELDEPTAAGQAAMSGLDAGRFHTLTRLTGDAPAPEAMAIALRRGFTDQAGYLRGIRQGRLRDEWADLIRQLATEDPSPTTAVLAAVKGQLDLATAQASFTQWGGNPAHWQVSFDVEGAGPSPLEAAEAARRGIIPWTGTGPGVTSFEQAVHESAYRNKWLAVFEALSVYLPPPRTVTAMLREGALTEAQGADLLTKQGLPADLAAAYLHAASRTKTTKARDLTQSTVETLYRDRLVTRVQAEGFLEALGYTAPEANLILEAEDLALIQKALTAAQGRVRTLFVGHKTTRVQAAAALAQLGVDATAADELLTIWDHERAANLHRLTPAEIAKGFTDGILDQPSAAAYLESLGMTPYDAWLLLSIHHGSALPGQPAQTTLPPAAGA